MRLSVVYWHSLAMERADGPGVAIRPRVRFAVTAPVPTVVISDLTALIFAQYQVNGGSIRLGGLQTETRPVYVALTPGIHGHEIQFVLDAYGVSLSAMDRGRLEIDDLITQFITHPDQPLGPVDEQDRPIPLSLQRTMGQAVSALAQFQRSGGEATLSPATLVLIIPYVFVSGKLSFSFQDAGGLEDKSVTQKFAAWAIALQRNPSLCSPYHCPLTGDCGRHLSTDDHGDIGLVDSMQVCSASGLKLLRFKLDRCANSGQWFCRSFLTASAVSDLWIESTKLSRCSRCWMPVERSGLDGRWRLGHCTQCRWLIANSAPTSDAVALLKMQRLMVRLIESDPSYQNYEAAAKTFRTNNRYHWVQFTQANCQHLMVFDRTDQLVVHRRRRHWFWFWSTVKRGQDGQPVTAQA